MQIDIVNFMADSCKKGNEDPQKLRFFQYIAADSKESFIEVFPDLLEL